MTIATRTWFRKGEQVRTNLRNLEQSRFEVRNSRYGELQPVLEAKWLVDKRLRPGVLHWAKRNLPPLAVVPLSGIPIETKFLTLAMITVVNCNLDCNLY